MMRQDVLERVNKCVKTGKANLAKLQITNGEILEIIQKIQQLQPRLSVINLDRNQLSDEGAVILANALQGFHQLSELSLQFNEIGRKGAISLFSLKRELTHLDILFHGNKISDVNEMDEIEKLASRPRGGIR